jgi:hypothetical protein
LQSQTLEIAICDLKIHVHDLHSKQSRKPLLHPIVKLVVIVYSAILTIVYLPAGILKRFDRLYWRNKDVYFRLRNSENFQASDNWLLEDELVSHGLYLVNGDYGTPPDVVVVQLKDKSLMKNANATVTLIQDSFARHGYIVRCVGNQHAKSIWGSRAW